MKPIPSGLWATKARLFFGVFVVWMVGSVSVSAQVLLHRYDMNTVNDSVGTSSGSLLNGAVLGNGSNGAATGTLYLNPTTNTGTGTSGAQLQLAGSAVSGITGGFALELWMNFTDNSTLQSLYNFSATSAASGANAITMEADHTGTVAGGQAQANFNQTGGTYTSTGMSYAGTTYFQTNTLYQTVLVYDPVGLKWNWYVNGNLDKSVAATTGFNLSLLNSIGIGGGLQYGEKAFAGTINDFRIYNGALTAANVSALYGLGQDASNASIAATIPEPSTYLSIILMFGLVYWMQFRKRSVI